MKVTKVNPEQIKKSKNWNTWEKEATEFPWEYDQKETCYILEGRAEVTSGTGETINFQKGDWVEFEKGLKCTWKIAKDIKKKYIFGEF